MGATNWEIWEEVLECVIEMLQPHPIRFDVCSFKTNRLDSFDVFLQPSLFIGPV